MTRASVLLAAVAGVASVTGRVLEKRQVNTAQFNNIELFHEYAAASYCQPNNDSPSSELICPNGGCPQVETAVTTTEAEFENSLLTDVTGFVATDATNEVVVVSFRGSQSIRNFIADAIAIKRDVENICPGCEAHAGFFNSWLEAREEVLAAVETTAAANPGFGVRVVGHSLGGAIAAFCAAELRNDGFDADLITFGCPRFGNQEFADFVSNQPGQTIRVTHLNDPIPRLPPRFLGYAHTAPEFYISTGNDVVPQEADIIRFADAENEEGVVGDDEFDVDAHSFYFSEISSCNDQGFEFKMKMKL